MLKLVPSIALSLLVSSALAAPSFASSLNHQLRVQYNNGTQGSARQTADRIVESGIQAQRSGLLDQAIADWNRALDLYQQIGEIPAQGRVYDLLGMTYIQLNQLNNAENAFRRSLGAARDEGNTIRQIYGYNNVGQVILQRGQTVEAANSFAEGVRIARQAKHDAGLGLSLSNLGLATYAQGRYQAAIAFLEEARKFRDQAKDPIGAANTLNNLGDAYRAVGSFALAYAAHDRAMTLAQTGSDQAAQFRAFDGMMLANRGMGQENRFTEMLNQRLAMANRSNDAWQMLNSLKMVAQHQQQQGKLTAAEGYYQQAYSVAQRLNATREQTFLREQLGFLRSRKFRWQAR